MDLAFTMPTTNETKRLNHALNNEKACNYLKESGAFPDWVITTAFYSALQFVKYKGFPIIIDGDTFNTFDEYMADYKRKNEYGTSPHVVIKKFLTKHFRKISSPYIELFDSCFNARYVDYDIRAKELNTAINNLAEIKKFCNTNKPALKKIKR